MANDLVFSFTQPKTVYFLLRSMAGSSSERITLSGLLFFLESNSIFSPCQAGFRPKQSSLDQIMFLSQSISDGFNKPRPGSGTILATNNFLKASGIPPCFARWTQSFLSDRRAWLVYQNPQYSFLSSPSRCSTRIRSWPCTFLSLYQ